MNISNLSSSYFIIKEPVCLCIMVTIYLSIIIFSLYFKPITNLSNNKIKFLLFLHNFISIVTSVYIFTGIIYETTSHNYYLYGNEIDYSHKSLTHYIWIFHISKYYDCVDTFIMIIRNSFKQITFVHVYHHTSVILYTWLILYNHPGGDFYLSALMNAWVHIWMYSYYMLSSFMTHKNKRRKYLWWSKHLTKVQISQFVVNCAHCMYALLYSSKMIYMIGLAHQFSFIVLFGNFFYKKYI